MPGTTAEQLKALWSRLNADPNAAQKRKLEPDWVVLQWEPHGVTIVDATVGSDVTLKRVVDLPWGGASNPDDSTASAGSLLKDRLAALKITTRQAAVIVGRDAVVVRRLELPAVPDNELPDMVRFQAATKASTPIDRMALDFVTLEAPADAPRICVTATLDAARLKTIQETIQGAGLELAAVGLAATALAELVSHAATSGSLPGISLVVFQKTDAVELAILENGRVSFAHALRLETGENGPVVQPLQAEISRALVALSQSRPEASVARVFVVPGAVVAPQIVELLEKRFPGLTQRIDPRDLARATALSSEDSTTALRAAPAIGYLLGVQSPSAPSIDFVNPRRRIDPPDTRKAKIRAVGGGVALLALLGIWMNMNAVSDREAQLAALTGEANDINQKVAASKSITESALRLKRWKESDPRPLQVMEKLSNLLPPTSELILTDIYIKPGKPASGTAEATIAAGLKAVAWAKTSDAIVAMEKRLAAGGYSFVSPILPEVNRLDPEYPLLYTLTADQLVAKPAPAVRRPPAAPPSSP